MTPLTEKQRKKIKTKGLAEKHNCTIRYVEMVLKGDRESVSEKAKSILQDAKELLKILGEENV